MGGRGKSRTQRKHFKQSRDNVWKRTKSEENTIDDNNNTNNEDTKANPSWQPLVTDNPAFEDYYKEQGIVGTEEWEAFMGCLRTALPAAFRINSSGQFCTEIREQLENDFAKSLQTESIDGSELEAIKPLPWYPENLAWHSNYSRKQLRKNQTLERFHEFLKLQNEIGNITRQEAVSMVPPLFLDVHPDHFVLDMCAAPGSKTFQLLEMIHSVTKPGSLPNGMVVANDLDVQRCNLLIHQTKRMCTANLIVTTNEAQHFPGCNLSKNRVYMKDHHDMMHLQFDRVLCDVPCSGDGTLRKAPDIWRKWNSGMGNGLHSLQVQIAMRGLSLLKVGGRMVYSTCSMNPVENEAVVAEILRRCGGSVELIDVSNEFTKLIRRPGLKTWKVRDRGVWLNSYKEVPELRKGAIFPSMFPSGKSKFNDQDETDEVTDLPLERCMRIVPHDQNTGAFFIVVLQKLSPLPNPQKKSGSYPGQLKVDSTENIPLEPLTEVKKDSESNETVLESETRTEPVLDSETRIEPDLDSETHTEPVLDSETRTEKAGEKRKLPSQGRWTGVDPVIFYKDETVTNQIKDFYGINDSFPFNGHLVTRNSDAGSVKRIYYVSKSVKNAIELNLSAGQQLKIASVGIKMFERQTSKEGANTPCLFRISSEGLPLLLPHITKQILYASPMDFKHLLEYKSIKFGEFVNPGFGETVDKLMMGCCIVVLNKDKGLSDVHEVNGAPIAIGCWRGRNNLAVMVTSLDCQELLERVSKYMEEIKEDSAMVENENGEKNESVLKEEVTEPIVG